MMLANEYEFDYGECPESADGNHMLVWMYGDVYCELCCCEWIEGR